MPGTPLCQIKKLSAANGNGIDNSEINENNEQETTVEEREDSRPLLQQAELNIPV